MRNPAQLKETDYAAALDDIARVRREHAVLLGAVMRLATFGAGTAKHIARDLLKSLGYAP